MTSPDFNLPNPAESSKTLGNDPIDKEKIQETLDSIPTYTDPYQIFLIIFITSLVSTWILTANGLLIFCLLKTHRKKEPWNFGNYYYMQVDAADCANVLLVIPLFIARFIQGNFAFGETLCLIWLYLDFYLNIYGTFAYISISLNYICLMKYPQTYLRIRFKTHRNIILFILALPFIILTPCFLFGMEHINYGECINLPEFNSSSYYIGFFGIIIPMIFIPILLIWTFELWKNSTKSQNLFHFAIMQIQNENGEGILNLKVKAVEVLECVQTAIYNLPIVICVNLLFFATRICFYLFFTSCIYPRGRPECGLNSWANWFSFPMHLNSALNPLILFILDKRVRQQTLKRISDIVYYNWRRFLQKTQN